MTPKTLYLDLDGTVLCRDTGEPKAQLRDGVFGRSVREAGFVRIVCVSNACLIVKAVVEAGVQEDAIGLLYRLCTGVFDDEPWFRDTVSLIDDPRNRVRSIDFSGDWYYADDLAEMFLEQEGRSELIRSDRSHRICVPDPVGDGADVLKWLLAIGSGADLG